MGVVVRIESEKLQLEAGGEASLTVTVTNTGSIIERFEIAVVGPLARWATVDPPALNLDAPEQPGSGFDASERTEREAAATGEARVTFRVPRAPDPLAGTYPFGIHVKATSDPKVARVEEGQIKVAPFVELETEVVPETSRGSFSGRHELTVNNRGNIAAEVSVKAVQVDRLLTFSVIPAQAGVLPGKGTSVRLRARPKDTFLMGTPNRIPFQIKVTEPIAGAATVPAYLDQRPIIPNWIKPLAGLAIAGLAAIVFLPPLLQAILPTPSGSPVAVITTGPTPTPVPTPTSAPTPLPPSPVGPPVTPTPAPTAFGPPDSLLATGDGGTIHPNIVLDCPADGPTADACRAQITGLVQRVLSNTLGIADGAPLKVFETDVAGTLAVVAIWEDGSWPVRDNRVTEPIKYAKKVAIDLAPLLQFGTAYVLVDDGSGEILPYIVSTGNAQLLLDSLYTVTGAPTPVPDPTGPGATARWDPGFWDRAILWGQPLNRINFGN